MGAVKLFQDGSSAKLPCQTFRRMKIPTLINSFPFPVILQHHIFDQQVADIGTSRGLA